MNWTLHTGEPVEALGHFTLRHMLRHCIGTLHTGELVEALGHFTLRHMLRHCTGTLHTGAHVETLGHYTLMHLLRLWDTSHLGHVDELDTTHWGTC